MTLIIFTNNNIKNNKLLILLKSPKVFDIISQDFIIRYDPRTNSIIVIIYGTNTVFFLDIVCHLKKKYVFKYIFYGYYLHTLLL